MATKKDNEHIKDSIEYGVKELMKALEADMYYGPDHAVKFKLRSFLSKMGIKSARYSKDSSLAYGAPLIIESLEATLRSITFEEKQIKYWKDKKDAK
jgi:hypothetical protein